MKKRYEHLNAEERATIMVMKGQSASVRAIARTLGRCCSTVSREVQRNTTEDCVYSARRAGDRARTAGRLPGGLPAATFDPQGAGRGLQLADDEIGRAHV